MRDHDPPISHRQRWLLTSLIGAMTLFGSVDVIGDLVSGASFEHVGIESVGLILGTIGIVWIWLQNLQLTRARDRLRRRLAEASNEAAAWQARVQDQLSGLAQAIDAQLAQWSLSAAEKEVALLLLKGLSLKEISVVRDTSERTVRQQAQEVYRKGKLGGRAELAAFFLEDLLAPRT